MSPLFLTVNNKHFLYNQSTNQLMVLKLSTEMCTIFTGHSCNALHSAVFCNGMMESDVPSYSQEVSLQAVKSMEPFGQAITSLHVRRLRLLSTLYCKQEFPVISLEVRMSRVIQEKQMIQTTFWSIKLEYSTHFLEHTVIFFIKKESPGCKLRLFKMSSVKVFFFAIN